MKPENQKTIKKALLGIIFGLAVLLFEWGIYTLARCIVKICGNDGVVLKIALDDKIPLLPAFIFVYVLSYAFWVLGTMLLYFGDRDRFCNFLCGFVISVLVGFLIFVFYPTIMDRNAENLFSLTSNGGFTNFIIRFIYWSDGGDIAYNLFVSFHCLISTIVYLGACGQKKFPLLLRAAMLLSVILICLSTVFTKQHYVLDVFGGIALAVISDLVTRKLNLGVKIYNHFLGKIKK